MNAIPPNGPAGPAHDGGGADSPPAPPAPSRIAPDAPWRAVPGPIDRDTFDAAQRRHRRAAAWLSLLASLAIVLMGVPLATILFPLLFGVAALISLPIAHLLHVPDLAGALVDHGPPDPQSIAGWIAFGATLAAPGVVLLFVLWSRVHRAVAAADPALVLARLGVRAPRRDDGEERQLVNVVEEIAIAARLPAPRVLLMDDTSINVAAFGSGPQNAALLVTRGLLDGLGRDATQALIADAIATIGNGDLRATLRWISLSAALAVARLALRAPWDTGARSRLVALRGLRRKASPDARQAALAALLDDLVDPPGDVDGGRVRRALVMPFYIAHAMFNGVAWMASLLFLSPALSLLLRRRRYLADAIAVQLTRLPEGLTEAFSEVIRQPRVEREPPQLYTILMMVAPPNRYARSGDSPLGFWFGTHPDAGKRFQRVARMRVGGAAREASGLAALPPRMRLIWLLALTVIVPLGAVAAGLMLWLIAALTLLTLVIGMMYVMVIVMPIRWLFGLL